MISKKHFRPKKSAKKLAFLTQNKAKLCKICDKNLGLMLCMIFKNRQKLEKK
jgi:hypothetical protein